MFAKTPTGKATKGTVSVSFNQNRLRLNLPRTLFGGQRKYISLNLADTPENRAIAEDKALQANLDIRNNQFDFSFDIKLPKRDDESDVNPFTVSEQLAVVEVWGMDENRLGLKPIIRRVWVGYNTVQLSVVGEAFGRQLIAKTIDLLSECFAQIPQNIRN